MQDSVGAALSLQSVPGDPPWSCCLDPLSYLDAWAKEVSGESALGPFIIDGEGTEK